MIKCVKQAVLLSALFGFAGTPALYAAWVNNGVAICSVSGTQDLPVVASDGSGGAIIVWRDNRTVNTDIYAQRVDAGGNVLWLANGNPVCTAFNAQSSPFIIPDGAGGVIVAWQDFRSGNVLDIYAQRVDATGYIQWAADGEPVCTGKTNLALNHMIPDGAGGAIIAWHDRRNATMDIFAQRISSTGAALWTANGVAVSAAAGNQMYPAIASEGTNGAIITWQDNRSGANDIYAQRVNAAGSVQWTADGVVICDAGQDQTSAQIIPDGSGGAIIAWSDHRNTLDYGVYAQRVDASGNTLWTSGGVIVSATTGDQMSCRLVPAGPAEAIVLWVDYRGGATSDIYAQKIDANGAAQWTSNGLAVCTATGNQFNIQAISIGSGEAVATWEDGRDAASLNDCYAQRIGASGGAVWTTDGVAVCTAAAGQATPQLAPDGVGGAIIAWKDSRGSSVDVYAQRVDAAGHTVVATLLRTFSASLKGSDVEIDWTLSEAGDDVEFFILRALGPAGEHQEMSNGDISGEGLSFRFVDDSCEPDETYQYRVDVRDGGERKTLFETGPIKTPPMPLALFQNHPNPFNPSTTIRYYAPERGEVTIAIYNARGDFICRLTHGNQDKGFHAVEWNGLDGRGNRTGSGVYFYRLTAGKQTLSRKMILLR